MPFLPAELDCDNDCAQLCLMLPRADVETELEKSPGTADDRSAGLRGQTSISPVRAGLTASCSAAGRSGVTARRRTTGTWPGRPAHGTDPSRRGDLRTATQLFRCDPSPTARPRRSPHIARGRNCYAAILRVRGQRVSSRMRSRSARAVCMTAFVAPWGRRQWPICAIYGSTPSMRTRARRAGLHHDHRGRRTLGRRAPRAVRGRVPAEIRGVAVGHAESPRDTPSE